ncbi:GNAT family N-acetyltransferase [Cellulomonas sp.]|uniref:GNAT family N-acetyltransferase n=1 Tax=Cellulomonas sp. TaxID=40001 RepID=UPI001B29AD2B|nr:GNAT family N-acetyltransferase [Cellulomonas sp.]MBO9552976.1 GNAT family N-acetyltransferase [Cellulomonas sp.]
MDEPRADAREVTPGPGWLVRAAREDDVEAICRFGETHVRAHYEPLIGPEHADTQVARWWSTAYVGRAVSRGLVVVALAGDRLAGVAQRGHDGIDHVLYKLYVDPRDRGLGLGPHLVDAIERDLPADARRLCVEHVAANVRAAAFYEREGFTVERVEASAVGDPALDVVWRARSLHRTGRA